jgi:hypothetical protein
MNHSLQQRLQLQPDTLHYLLTLITTEEALMHPLPGKWSIAENIAHLARLNEVYIVRMRRIEQEEIPFLDRYVAEEDEGFASVLSKDFKDVVDAFFASRKKLNDYFFSLTDEQLERKGKHPVYGEMNITGWAEFFMLHESHHYFTCFKLFGLLRK